MEALGNVIDKLVVTNLKIWFLQDWIHKTRDKSLEEFQKETHESIQEKVKDLGDLNLYRNKLMDEIDEIVDAAQRGQLSETHRRVKVL